MAQTWTVNNMAIKNYSQKKKLNFHNANDLSKKANTYDKGLSKYDRMMSGIDTWASFYRANPHIFVEDYIGIKLKPFQVILLNQMNDQDYFMYIASRGQGKTFLTAVYCVVRAILYPESKIVIASKTMKQSREVIEKIDDEMKKSANLRREISDLKTGLNDSHVTFHNGSWIKTVAASDNARGELLALLNRNIRVIKLWKKTGSPLIK